MSTFARASWFRTKMVVVSAFAAFGVAGCTAEPEDDSNDAVTLAAEGHEDNVSTRTDTCLLAHWWYAYGDCNGGLMSKVRVNVFRCANGSERFDSIYSTIPCTNNPPQTP